MMSRPEIVTFALGSGAKVTAPRHLAERLGWTAEPERAAEPETSEPETSEPETPEPETSEPETPGRRKK